MQDRALRIANGTQDECIWFLEHPPLYTRGTSAKDQDLLAPNDLPVFVTGRGGQFTYHGPGQRVVYVMIDLKKKGGDLRKYVSFLEEWIIQSLKELGITGFRREGRVGIWVTPPPPDPESKIAALGVRIQKGVTLHGIALNVDPNLTHFQGIVPCGLKDFGVTSIRKLNTPSTMEQIDSILQRTFTDLLATYFPKSNEK